MRAKRAILVPGLILGFFTLSVSAARAAEPLRPYLMGASWEDGVVRGIDRQDGDRRRAQGSGFDSMVSFHVNQARRDPSLANLYLLGRGFALRYVWRRKQIAAQSNIMERAKHERLAPRDYSEAVSAYRDVLKREPSCYFAYHDLGMLELQRQNPDRLRAYTYLVKALSINDRYVDARRKLVLLYLERKQYPEAIPVLTTLIHHDPSDRVARVQLINAYAMVKRYDVARTHLQPLLQSDPKNPTYRDLSAKLDAKTGRPDVAIRTYRQLASENPTMRAPFIGILQVVEERRAAKQKFKLEDYHYALTGLMRLERDATRREKLRGDLAKLERAMAAPVTTPRDPNKPPTETEIVAVMTKGDTKQRRQVLLYVLARKENPSPTLLKYVMRHIAERNEPDAVTRVIAIRVLGRRGGSALVPLVRLALDDGDEGVRSEATDTLVRIAERDESANRSVIVILGHYALVKGVEFPAAVRSGILRLANATLTLAEENQSDRAHRDAFRVWWRKPIAEDLIITGLDAYARLNDRFADQILLPFTRSPSFLVFKAAWRGLDTWRNRTLEAGLAGGVRQQWLMSLPKYSDQSCVPAKHEALRATLQSWAEAKPK